VKQKGMGTFSMMFQADPYFFNRVLFELEYTALDVLQSTPEAGFRDSSGYLHRGLGEKKIKVHFVDLLLGLCHIRFSRSVFSSSSVIFNRKWPFLFI